MTASHVKDVSLAQAGVNRIEWAGREMPVIRQIHERFAKEQPLKGQRLACCLHVTTETANLMLAFQAGGASVALCASNPLSTQDDVAAALAETYGIPTFAINGEDNDTYYQHLASVLATKPTITIDDGADLITTIHQKYTDLIPDIIAGMEETTTGIIRLQSMAADGHLPYPVFAVNDAETKHLFDNRYGTGQSTLDGITRATNVLWAAKRVVVVGYGWCGKGIAMRAKGLGSKVYVTEINPVRALEAAMDGFEVGPMSEAAKVGDIFITVTGGINGVDSQHFAVMKDGALVANSGHFNVEVNIKALEAMSEGKRQVKPFVEEYTLEDGRHIYLLGEGRLINLTAAEGHPASVMDMSFANQALCAEYVAKLPKKLSNEMHPVPPEIDQKVASLKLQALGMEIDTLTDAQRKYLESWTVGT